jgi:peptidoglycan/xylan/chitin deacetylase (PgdA/CDA1 family)
MSERPPSRHARTVAVAALVTAFVMFLLAVVLAMSSGDGGGGGSRASTTSTTSTTPKRPTTTTQPAAPAGPAEPGVPANAPGAHRAASESVPILAYDVINQPKSGVADPSIWVPTEEFTAQMTYLADQGFHPVTLRQVWAAWKENGVLPSKPIVITFDTGYHSVYSNAFPVLREHSFPATLFLDPAQTQADFPDTEVKELIQAGWELGAQPSGQGDILSATDEQLAQAIGGARRELQRQFGRRVEFLSYPAGKFDQRVSSAVQSAGFLGAVTLQEGLASPQDPPYELKRIPIRNGDGADGLTRKLQSAGVK